MSSPYKIRYEIIGPTISANGAPVNILDKAEIVDDYEEALARSKEIFEERKFVRVFLLLVGPNGYNDLKETVLYRTVIFEAQSLLNNGD